ncbi:MAG: 5'-nucleotidase [Pseudomonadota bacterium]
MAEQKNRSEPNGARPDRLVVGVASSALFDLDASDRVYREDGVEAFRKHQRERLGEPFEAGPALPFIQRLLALNAARPAQPLVEVVLMSRNDAETGRRAFRSIAHYGLPIARAAFTQGESPDAYGPAFGAALFLSTNAEDVRTAIDAGRPAGRVSPGAARADDPNDPELRIAFDFDGVLADDASERVFASRGLDAFRAHEDARRAQPHGEGPLLPLLRRIAAIQAIEADAAATGYIPRLKTAIVTARGAPATERVVASLLEWGVRIDKSFFMDGADKAPILATLRPHIFFDDQEHHVAGASKHVAAVHVPFGVKNQQASPA